MLVGNSSFVFGATPSGALFAPRRRTVDSVRRWCALARAGFTVLEMVVVLFVIGVLIVMLLPAVQSSRESARRASCVNSLMQIGVAVHGYSNAFGQLPMPLGGTDGSPVAGAGNHRRLSFIVPLLPFLDQQTLAERIAAPGGGGMDRPEERLSLTAGGDEFEGMDMEIADVYPDDMDMGMSGGVETFESLPPDDSPAGGREPWSRSYYPWKAEPAVLLCPSDPAHGKKFGLTNYTACSGDGIVGSGTGPFVDVDGRLQFDAARQSQIAASMRGMFVPRTVTRLSDVTDGLSQTLMLAEVAVDLGARSIKTTAAVGPGIESLRDQPTWVRTQGLIDTERPQFWTIDALLVSAGRLDPISRGGRWADGAPMFTSFNTILPPNQACVLADDREDSAGILPPSSRHQGGAGVCFADGSVAFITDFVDNGDLDRPTVYVGSPVGPQSPSPYGVWGAMGTRASGELASLHAADAAAN